MTVVDQVFFLILDLLDAAYPLILPVVIATFTLTLSLGFLRLGFAVALGEAENPMGSLVALLISVFVALAFIYNAQAVLNGFGNFALSVGTGIVGATEMTPEDFGPSGLWGVADKEHDKLMAVKWKMCTSTWECIKTADTRIMLEIAGLFIFMSFVFLIFVMAVTAIGYKIASIFSVLFTPMSALKFTKSFAEGSLQGLVNHGVKLVLIAMVAGIASQAFDLMNMPPMPVFDDVIPAVLLSVFVAFLAWQTQALAAGVISAVPQLSSHSIGAGAANVMKSVSGGFGAVKSLQRVAGNEKASIGATANRLAAGAKAAPGRIKNAAAAVRSGDVAKKAYWQKMRAGGQKNAAGASGGGAGSGGGPKARNASGGASTGARTASNP